MALLLRLHPHQDVLRGGRQQRRQAGPRSLLQVSSRVCVYCRSVLVLPRVHCVRAVDCVRHASPSPERIDSFLCSDKVVHALTIFRANSNQRNTSTALLQSDVWALGIVLLELLLGRFPYALAHADDGGDYLDLLDSIASQEVPICLRPVTISSAFR
jgi:hypothetical protein